MFINVTKYPFLELLHLIKGGQKGISTHVFLALNSSGHFPLHMTSQRPHCDHEQSLPHNHIHTIILFNDGTFTLKTCCWLFCLRAFGGQKQKKTKDTSEFTHLGVVHRYGADSHKRDWRCLTALIWSGPTLMKFKNDFFFFYYCA